MLEHWSTVNQTPNFTTRMVVFFIALFLLVYASGPGAAQTTEEGLERQRSLRLPNTTYPLHYHLHITTDAKLEHLTFNGNATIDIEIKATTNEIVFHAKNLTDFAISVRDLTTGELVDGLTHAYDVRAHFLIIHPSEEQTVFQAGRKYRVEVLYTGLIQETPRGVYRLTYNNNNTDENRIVNVVATQFEPTSARMAFPCYDEPAFKANISLSITHSSTLHALSNMPMQHLQNHSDSSMHTTTFEATPVMCTYLVAFVISDFEYIKDEYRGITQRIFTSPSTPHKGRKALKNVLRTVPALGDYFGISYPLSKLDHVALKRVYGVAMENWGLITYKEDIIVHQEERGFHKVLSDIMAQNHEIAHQWFGNLVSPEWWSYAWMNEGFSTYFSYVITDLLYPDYKIMEFFQTEVVEHAYGSNYIAVRPMTQYVEKESDIVGVFDIITYQKSASMVKMFHHAFNQKTFVRGISDFLRKYQYLAANEMQLADCLQQAVAEDPVLNGHSWSKLVMDILATWTHNTRIPVVTVTRNYEDNTITIRQSANDPESKERWWIPLNFASESAPDFSRTIVDYFMPPVTEVTLTPEQLGIRLAGDDWLIVNKQQTGFYHMVYDEENLLKIAKKLQTDHTAIHYLNRAALFQNSGPLIEDNDIKSVKVIFELLKYLRKEEDLMPWNFVSDIVDFLEQNLYGSVSHNLYKQFVRYLIAPTFQRLFHGPQPNNLTNNDIFMREKVLEMACTADLQDCLDYTHELALDYILHELKPKANMDYYLMNESILCGGLRYLTEDEFSAVLELFSKCEHNSSLFYELVYALRCTQSSDHLEKYLNLLSHTFWQDIMYDKESMTYLSYLYKSNMAARPVLWHFIEQNYKLLCHSPYFVEVFNRLAQYVPQSHRSEFTKLRETIADELVHMNDESRETLIFPDSPRIGSKIKQREAFLERFGQDAYDWLLENQEQLVYQASSMSTSNSSSRNGDLFRLTRRHFRSLFQSMRLL